MALDANLKDEVITAILQDCQQRNIESESHSPSKYALIANPYDGHLAVLDPTSLPKMKRLVHAFRYSKPSPPSSPRLLTHFAPNLLETKELFGELQELGLTDTDEWFEYIDSLRLGSEWRNGIERLASSREHDIGWLVNAGVGQMMVSLLPWVGDIWMKCGENGLMHLGIRDTNSQEQRNNNVKRIQQVLPTHFTRHGFTSGSQPALALTHYPPFKMEHVVSTTGAGDSLVGGLIAGLASGLGQEKTVDVALKTARASLGSSRAVGDINRSFMA